MPDIDDDFYSQKIIKGGDYICPAINIDYDNDMNINDILSNKEKGYKGFPVDIWSAGIALYIMLSGKLPFNLDEDLDDIEGESGWFELHRNNQLILNSHHPSAPAYSGQRIINAVREWQGYDDEDEDDDDDE